MQHYASEVVSIADACLGGLRGRSALLIGPEEQRRPYVTLLQKLSIKHVYEEDAPRHLAFQLPQVQLLMSLGTNVSENPSLSAAAIAHGCIGRRTPLIIFDLAPSTSVEEVAGLLPAVCLYTPDDLHRILARTRVQLG